MGRDRRIQDAVVAKCGAARKAIDDVMHYLRELEADPRFGGAGAFPRVKCSVSATQVAVECTTRQVEDMMLTVLKVRVPYPLDMDDKDAAELEEKRKFFGRR